MELLGTFILPTEPRAVTKGFVLLHLFLVIPEKRWCRSMWLCVWHCNCSL